MMIDRPRAAEVARIEPRGLRREDAARVRVVEVSRLTSLSGRAVQDMAAQGKIPGAAKLGRVWTFDAASVRAWIRLREAELWPSELHGAATGEALFSGGSSPLPAASTDALYERLMRQKPGVGTRPGETR